MSLLINALSENKQCHMTAVSELLRVCSKTKLSSFT